jgi:hypothetical protein
MLNFNNITLSAVFVPWDKDKILSKDLQDEEKDKSVNSGVEDTIKALYTCMEFVNFSSVKFITSKEVIGKFGDKLLKDGIVCEESSISICNMKDYSKFMIYDLNTHIDTDFTLTIQYDGFIINPDAWRDEFLDYDYIGAPWPMPNDNFSYRDINGNLIRVGNSVSLRSKKLIDLPVQLNLEWKAFHGYYNEDGYICVNYRHIYLEHGMKFADIDIAKHFSIENEIPENKGIPTFAFHNKAFANQILNSI